LSNQNQIFIKQKDTYIKLSKSIESANKQKIEKVHKQVVSSGMKIYSKGDKIQNRYEVFFRKQGNLGIVYLCYDHKFKDSVAIKTILPKYLNDQQAKEDFKKEALIWVNLDSHYNIVTAKYVQEIDCMPAIFMELIVGDENYGSDLAGYIGRYRFSTEEAIKLSIQFCNGMIYAEKKFKEIGKVFVHRDIKPQNIMITRDRVLKITDFGLVKIKVGDKKWCGTPGYMSPEQYEGKEVDTRADIYSFGCVLYEIFCNGKKPYELIEEKELENVHSEFLGRFLQRKHLKEKMIDPAPFLPESKVKTKIRNIIVKCLEKEKEKRFKDFVELREILEKLYYRLTGKRVPGNEDKELETYEWVDKGVSLYNLGSYEEAGENYNKALKVVLENADAWNSEGVVLNRLGRYEDAIERFDKALKINPQKTDAWNNKGIALNKLGRYGEAIECFDKALKIDPEYTRAWNAKGVALYNLGMHEKAIECFDKALKIDPEYTRVWNAKGIALYKLGKDEKAIECFDNALGIDIEDTIAWYNKGGTLYNLGNKIEGIKCIKKAANLGYPLAVTALKQLGGGI